MEKGFSMQQHLHVLKDSTFIVNPFSESGVEKAAIRTNSDIE